MTAHRLLNILMVWRGRRAEKNQDAFDETDLISTRSGFSRECVKNLWIGPSEWSCKSPGIKRRAKKANGRRAGKRKDTYRWVKPRGLLQPEAWAVISTLQPTEKNVYPGTEKELLNVSLLIIPERTRLKLGEVETSNTLEKTIQRP